jgi:hypothetical protein
MAVVALCDRSLSLPSGKEPEAIVRELEPMARAGRVFYLVDDDPGTYRVEVLAGEDPPASLSGEFEPSGGTFGLDLPSGRATLYGWTLDGVAMAAGVIESTPGPHVLTVLARRPFDASRHTKEMSALLGSDWTYARRVDRFGLIGCLPLFLTAITMLARKWHWLPYLLAFLAVSWVPYLLLRLTSRYKRSERKQQEIEQARPHFVLSITPSAQGVLTGGFLRV